MRICVVGTGYVGLVSGACLADVGHEVVCVDVDPDKVARINRGEAPIHEDGLPEILQRTVGTRLSATTDLAAAFNGADVALICVGTPFDGRTIDLQYVTGAAQQLGALLRERRDYTVVAVKSTVVPGTTDTVVRQALESTSGKIAGRDFGLGMNPEFLAEGVAVRDFMQPDRIVVGGVDQRSTSTLAAMYAAFPGVPVLHTTPRTAEMIKYASNSLMATMISFSNELARYCEALGGVDVADVLPGVHLMSHLTAPDGVGGRKPVGIASFLWAGCGFGGSCFPKDVKALIAHGQANGAPMPLLDAVIGINKTQPLRMLSKAREHLGPLAGRRVTVLGIAFKPGTDDVRESPAVPIVIGLLAEGARVAVHDPIALDTGRRELDSHGVPRDAVRFESDLESALTEADVVFLVTRWPDYVEVPRLLERLGRSPLVVDGRRLLSRDSITNYDGVGMRRGTGLDRSVGSVGRELTEEEA
jgi:UDPglucose 6-dehydrogenase/GDP-mannose 6-dehydrogenase